MKTYSESAFSFNKRTHTFEGVASKLGNEDDMFFLPENAYDRVLLLQHKEKTVSFYIYEVVKADGLIVQYILLPTEVTKEMFSDLIGTSIIINCF